MESDLHQIIVSPQKLTEDHIKVFIYQIIRGTQCSQFVLHVGNGVIGFISIYLAPAPNLLTESCLLHLVPCTSDFHRAPVLAFRWHNS